MYKGEREFFEAYRNFMESVLRRYCGRIDPLCVVQARLKGAASFSEKCVRKGYAHPLEKMTDLCGARVIVSTPETAQRVCDFIESRFKVDVPNSGDKRRLLRSHEFGYLSIHYVVQVPPLEGERRSQPANQGASQLKPLGLTKEEGEWLQKLNQGRTEDGLRKAEIQVRSVLQHAWADAFHDRVYKTRLNLPEAYKREVNRIAAMLEQVDAEVGSLIAAIDAFEVDSGAHADDATIDKEMDLLNKLLRDEELNKEWPSMGMRLAKLARAKGDWPTIIYVADKLTPVSDAPPAKLTAENVDGARPAELAELKVEKGHALCRMAYAGRGETSKEATFVEIKEGWRRGKESLCASCAELREAGHPRLLARAHAYLGWAELWGPDPASARALEEFESARELEPTNPYYFKALLENQIAAGRIVAGTLPVKASVSELREALKTCRQHADAHTELPAAFFAQGFFHLVLGEDAESLFAYLKGIAARSTSYQIAAELEVVGCMQNSIPAENALHEKLEQVRRLLLLALVARRGTASNGGANAGHDKWASALRQITEEVREEITGLTGAGVLTPLRSGPVAIVVGGAGNLSQADNDKYRGLLCQGLAGLHGTIFSGGTGVGVPGMVADAVRGDRDSLDLVAYLPEPLPEGVKADPRYRRLIVSAAPGGKSAPGDNPRRFSYSEVIYTWTHLLLAPRAPQPEGRAGVDPCEVRVLGIGGGSIAKFEYCLALALGATVGVVRDSGGEATLLLKERGWWDRERKVAGQLGQLVELPEDKDVVRAFLLTSVCPVPDRRPMAEQLERAAEKAHELYGQDNPPRATSWTKVGEDLQRSCLHQVSFAKELLAQFGYRVQECPDGDTAEPLVELGKDDVEEMARLEHGRWVVERHMQGWAWGKETDRAQRIHTSLVPWDQLGEPDQERDRQAIRHLPEVLRAGGWHLMAK
jgi:ppGpp synthetase/RelA/SpoT-type nucleotidyltranferase